MQTPLQSDGPALSENERFAANRTAIYAELRANGVARALASYTGSGDSGGPEGVRFEMPEGGALDDIPEVPQYRESSLWADGAWHSTTVLEDKPLDDAISDLAMDLVEKHFGGWEDGDGASGEVVFDATDGSLVIEHRAYFTDSDYHEVRR